MTDLENCCQRYEKKFSDKAIVNGMPTMHFCEILAIELRKAEKKIVDSTVSEANFAAMLGSIKLQLTDEKELEINLCNRN